MRRVAKATECRLDAFVAPFPRAPSVAAPRARGRPLSPAVTPGTSADAMGQPEPRLAAVACADAGGRLAPYPTPLTWREPAGIPSRASYR